MQVKYIKEFIILISWFSLSGIFLILYADHETKTDIYEKGDGATNVGDYIVLSHIFLFVPTFLMLRTTYEMAIYGRECVPTILIKIIILFASPPSIVTVYQKFIHNDLFRITSPLYIMILIFTIYELSVIVTYIGLLLYGLSCCTQFSNYEVYCPCDCLNSIRAREERKISKEVNRNDYYPIPIIGISPDNPHESSFQYEDFNRAKHVINNENETCEILHI